MPKCDFVVPPGFEPGQTEPKSVVLPLHHGTIYYYKPERRTGLEPATSTLEGSNSTNWATSANWQVRDELRTGLTTIGYVDLLPTPYRVFSSCCVASYVHLTMYNTFLQAVGESMTPLTTCWEEASQFYPALTLNTTPWSSNTCS